MNTEESVPNPRELVVSEYVNMIREAIESFMSVKQNIQTFIQKVEENRDKILNRLEDIRATPTKNLDGAVLVDPLNKLFSLIKIEPLDEDEPVPKVYVVRMEPPYIPHFFLSVGYIYLKTGLCPATMIRTVPVLSLMMLMSRGDTLSALVTHVASSATLMDKIVFNKASIIPLIPELMDLPVKSDKIFLTSLGYSTVPLEGLGFNVEVDLSDIPSLPEEIYTKAGFVSYREVLDKVLEQVVI